MCCLSRVTPLECARTQQGLVLSDLGTTALSTLLPGVIIVGQSLQKKKKKRERESELPSGLKHTLGENLGHFYYSPLLYAWPYLIYIPVNWLCSSF